MPRNLSGVDWYGDNVSLIIQGATDEIIEQVGFQVEANAKANITRNGQVDTGFMRASVYHNSALSSTYGAPRQEDRNMAPEIKPPANGGVVAVGAEYAIYQEMKQSFLYAALEQSIGDTGGIITTVAKNGGLT